MKKNIISLAIVFLLVCALVSGGVFAHPEDATEEARDEYTKELAELGAEYTEEVTEAQAKADGKLAELQEKLSEAQVAGDAEEVAELEAEIAEVKEELAKELAKLEEEYAEKLAEIEEELHEEEQEGLEEELEGEEDEDSVEEDDDDETEDAEDADEDSVEEESEDKEELEFENEDDEAKEFNFENVDEVSEEHDAAESASEYARAYYFMTEKILTAEAVIGFLQENYPDVDTTTLEAYKAELVALRDSLTEESDFHAVKEQVKSLIAAAREELKTILEENNVDKDALHQAVNTHKEESEDDDEAKIAWGLERSAYAQAKARVVLARLHNYEKVAERYADKVSAENLEMFKSILTQLESIADQIAVASENFDKEEIDGLVDQAKELTKEAKELAKDMRDEVREAHKAARDAVKEAREVARDEAKDAVDEAKETVKNAREEAKTAMANARATAKEAREKHGSARGVTAEEDEEESEGEDNNNDVEEDDSVEEEH